MGDTKNSITLRLSGLGHTLIFDKPLSCSILDFKKDIQSKTNIPVNYQKLLARGHKLDDDNMTLEEAGLKDRTRIILLHNELYTKEKSAYEALQLIETEIHDLKEKKEKDGLEKKVISELVTRLCCRLDAIEVNKSDTLRSMRKNLLKRVESLDDDEKIILESLQSIENEINDIKQKKERDGLEKKVINELVTRICCRLDAIDVSKSDTLRDMRRDLLRRVESLDDS